MLFFIQYLKYFSLQLLCPKVMLYQWSKINRLNKPETMRTLINQPFHMEIIENLFKLKYEHDEVPSAMLH